MICEILQDLNNSGALTAKRLARLLQKSDSTAYRYIAGDIEPEWGQMCTIFQHCASQVVQERILADLVDATGWACEYIDTDLDVNADGEINTDDVLDGAISANKSLSQLLVMTREEQKAGMKTMGRARATSINDEIDRSLRVLMALRRTVALLSPPQSSHTPRIAV